MTKQTQANHMNLKSIAKFWQFTLLFFLALIVFNELLFKLYEGIYKTLFLNDIGIFLILTVLFAFLFWELIGQIKAKTQVVWKLRDAFITAALIKSLWLIIWAFITLSIVPLSYFNFIDYSIYKWISSNPFKNIHLIIAFVYCAGIYLALKYYYWDAKTKQINSVQRNKKESFELNDDRTLGETEAFQNCTTLAELKEQDKLGRFDYAQQISHIIINNGEKKSFAIGINGEWGSGKTSFIDMIKRINEIDYPGHCIFINFNPWYFTGTEKVLKKFYDTLIKTVGNNFSITFRNDLSKYFELICATESKIWKTNFLQYFKKSSDFESQLNDLKAHFKELPQKIVIIIDDLDRLQKDEILVLFRTIRLIADFPNVAYLVGYSPNYLDYILEEDDADSETSFTGKIFQLEFELPDPLPSDLLKYWKSVIEKFIKADSSGLQDRIVKNIVKNYILPNLRDIKRFLNQFTINSSLPEIQNNTYLPQLFLLELIYYCDPIAYYNIRSTRSFDDTSYLEKDEKIDPGTLKLKEQIKELSNLTEQSILEREHIDKYFFKRLDKAVDIDFEHVLNLFKNSEYEREFKKLYFINKSQIVDHVLEFANRLLKQKETIDKTIGIPYLKRVLFLFDFIFKTEGLDKEFFKKKDSVKFGKLVSSASVIWEAFSYNNPAFIAEFKSFLRSILEYKSFSYFITLFKQDSNDASSILLDLNRIFQEKITHELNDLGYDTVPILIDLYNYKKFFTENASEIKTNNVLYADEVLNLVRSKSEYLNNDFKKLNKEYSVTLLDFFIEREYFDALNNFKTDGVFKLLENFSAYYPIKVIKSESYHSGEFEFDGYNYKINLPLSFFELQVIPEDNNELIEIKIDKNNPYDFWIQKQSNENMFHSLLGGKYDIVFFRIPDGTYFFFTDKEDNPMDGFGKVKISENPFVNFKIAIKTRAIESYTTQRKIIPKNVLTKLEAIAPGEVAN
ncbi:P-loop NTPase fold protein [Marinifilum fragile]|uniref:KAP family P-loop NTPase fold protein n=1 Tax=Marinifilum fragile TaxID=570161 RepID=UPI002AAB6062|nr:P-loop NTPase fold protein [Marinifilum fragile]